MLFNVAVQRFLNAYKLHEEPSKEFDNEAIQLEDFCIDVDNEDFYTSSRSPEGSIQIARTSGSERSLNSYFADQWRYHTAIPDSPRGSFC